MGKSYKKNPYNSYISNDSLKKDKQLCNRMSRHKNKRVNLYDEEYNLSSNKTVRNRYDFDDDDDTRHYFGNTEYETKVKRK